MCAERGAAALSGYILHDEGKTIVLTADAVERLVVCGNGDAALLYLELQRLGTGVTAQQLMQRLRWSRLRLDAAEAELQHLGLLPGSVERKPLEAPDERAVYTAADLAEMLTGDGEFKMLVPQVEEKLGKKLKTADLQILAGLYDDLGLPADVIYLLVSHCITRAERRYGPGRRPTMRQVEKEGYYWARLGLFDQDSAAAYLKTCALRDEQMGRYMQVLGLGSRRPVESEERYIRSWMDMGFEADAVAQAYDKTVFYKKELNWRYLNGILRRWHEQGWHSGEEVRRGDEKKPEPKKGTKTDLDKYMKW